MRRAFRALATALAVLLLSGLGLHWIGPTEPVDLTPLSEAPDLDPDLDAMLAAREAAVPALRPAAAKRIVWAGDPGQRTDLALVYLHGFSASAEELRPVPDQLAERLGANLYFARLAGHGRDGLAMAEPGVADWAADVAEAMAIGSRLGERVVLLGTSFGGNLSVLAASEPALAQDLAGIALVSPAFRVAQPVGVLLEMPGLRQWGPLLVGRERGFEPVNEAHAAHWTTQYPTVALAPFAAAIRATRARGLDAIDVPLLLFVSSQDQIVDVRTARRIAGSWRGPRQIVPVTLGPDADPAGHLLAGDVLSPGQTEAMVRQLAAWADGL